MITYEDVLNKDLPQSAVDEILAIALTPTEQEVYKYFNSNMDISFSKFAEDENDSSRQWYHQVKKRLVIARLIGRTQLEERQKRVGDIEKWRKKENPKLCVNGLKKRIVKAYLKWKGVM